MISKELPLCRIITRVQIIHNSNSFVLLNKTHKQKLMRDKQSEKRSFNYFFLFILKRMFDDEKPSKIDSIRSKILPERCKIRSSLWYYISANNYIDFWKFFAIKHSWKDKTLTISSCFNIYHWIKKTMDWALLLVATIDCLFNPSIVRLLRIVTAVIVLKLLMGKLLMGGILGWAFTYFFSQKTSISKLGVGSVWYVVHNSNVWEPVYLATTH